MVDLTQQTTEGVGCLAKLAFRRSGRSDEAGLIADADIAVSLETTDDAEIVNRMLPGALSAWSERANGDESKSRLSRVPTNSQRHAIIAGIHDGAATYEGPAEIRSMALVSSPAATVLTIRLRLFDLQQSVAGALCMLIGEFVGVRVEQQQQTLAFVARQRPHERIATVRDADGVIRFGRVVDWTDNRVSVDDFGEVVNVEPDAVASVVNVRGDQLPALLDYYRESLAAGFVRPTWEHLIVALGKRYAVGETESDGDVWTLDDATVAEAIADACGSVVVA